MQYWVMTITYTEEARHLLVKHPQNRLPALSSVVEMLGGKVYGAWLALEEYDVLAILELADYETVGAMVATFKTGGAVQEIKVKPLMKIQGWLDKMHTKSLAHYHPPKK